VCPVFCFFKEGKGFWEGKSLKIVVKKAKVFLFSRDCKIKIKLYICNLKINKSIWYVCNRRDSRATIQSKQRPKGLRSPFDK
jgi:hypothetical protein